MDLDACCRSPLMLIPVKPGISEENFFLSIDQPIFGVFAGLDIWEFLIKGPDDPVAKEYFQFMLDIARLVGADTPTAKQQLKDAFNFELDLAKIMTPPEVRRGNLSQLYNTFTLQELMHHPELGWVNWAKYLDGVLPSVVDVFPNQVIIGSVSYFIKLGALLNSTRPEIVANFMIWRAIMHVIPFLDSRIIGRKDTFEAILTGTQQTPQRWQRCVKDVSSLMSVSTSSMYIKRFVNPSVKSEAEKMVAHISEEMLSTIQQGEWMQFWTKQRSKRKMIAMKKWIGYPAELLDPLEMKKYFKNLTMNIDHYFEAAIDARRFDNRMIWSTLNDETSDYREDWRQHTVSYDLQAAYYTQIQNSIDFSAPFLQPPFFWPDVPDYVNYAGLGVIIGHEITHGFDDQGAKFNFLGNLEDWWDNHSRDNFNKKLQCFIDQYGNFTDHTTNLKINGELTLGENVADQGGLKVTYNAYTNLKKDESALPGLEHMNSKQLFLLSVANSWCVKMRPELLENYIKIDPHAPDEFRITGMMMNLEDFGDLFGCPVGSRMNPQIKCTLW